MKKFIFAFLVLGSLMRMNADEVLKNSDFSDGITDWHGNGQAPSDFAPASPLDPPSPYGTTGLIVVLKPHEWTKIVQEFRTQYSTLIMDVAYKLSSDYAPSSTDADYQNVPHQVGFDHWRPFNANPGGWVAMVSDFDKERLTFFKIKPNAGGADQQEFKGKIQALVPENEKTICLAFPPGTGAIILLKVSLSNE